MIDTGLKYSFVFIFTYSRFLLLWNALVSNLDVILLQRYPWCCFKIKEFFDLFFLRFSVKYQLFFRWLFCGLLFEHLLCLTWSESLRGKILNLLNCKSSLELLARSSSLKLNFKVLVFYNFLSNFLVTNILSISLEIHAF